MSKNKENQNFDKMMQYAPVFGVVLVVSGLLLLIDQRIKTTWLSISIPIFISLILTFAGIYLKKLSWIVSGLIITGLSGFLFASLEKALPLDMNIRLAAGFGVNALSWILIFVTFLIKKKKLAWWSLFVPAICIGLATIFGSNQKDLLDFIIFISVPIGMVFLLWGLTSKVIGLVIPGVLISTIALGVYMGWHGSDNPDGLMETGIMLVWFSLGWLLITVLSRIIVKSFIWWPLIPAGILLMVGSGLYIGGDPGNTLGFLGNTGSIGLILFGIYLILLKFGMNNKD